MKQFALNRIFKKSTALLIINALLIYSSEAFSQSLPHVCSLKNQVVTSALVTSEQIKQYHEQLQQECELAKKYEDLNAKALKKGLKATDFTEYQAMRFVQRTWFEKAKAENKPVEKTYQSFKETYKLNISEQTTSVWDNWAFGIQNLDYDLKRLASGELFSVTDLKKAHRNFFPFYPLVTEKGDFAHEPYPGVLKARLFKANYDQEGYWWVLQESEVLSVEEKVKAINEYYQNLNILAQAPEDVPSYVKDVLSVRQRPSRKNPAEVVWAIHSGSDIVNRDNVFLMLKTMNNLLLQARQGQPMQLGEILLTPAKLAFFIQQLYVRIHPFYEGNGRTSRYLQELIMLSFGLPHGASGDLMDDDVLTFDADYYKIGLAKTDQLLDRTLQCLENSQTSESYECQILKNRDQHFQELKLKNEIELSEDFVARTQELSLVHSQNETTSEKNRRLNKQKSLK